MSQGPQHITKASLRNQHDDWDEVHNQMLEAQRMQLQKKSLAISEPGDADEKEADEVAQKVTSGESASIHGTGGTINRKGEGSTETTQEFQSELDASKGGGQSLDDSTRNEMESKMGADFSGVKIHTGGEANQMSESINAKAYTHGQDIYFKDGQHNPASSEGKELLAHELVHTIQQLAGESSAVQRMVDPEWEAVTIVSGQTHYSIASGLKKKYSLSLTVDEIISLLKEKNGPTLPLGKKDYYIPTEAYFISRSLIIPKPVVNENTTPVVNENVTPVVNENTTPVVNENTTPVVNENTTPVVNENTTPVVNENVTPVVNENTTPVVNENVPPVNENPKLYSDVSSDQNVNKVELVYPTNHRNNYLSASEGQIDSWYTRDKDYAYGYWWMKNYGRYSMYSLSPDTQDFFILAPDTRDSIMSIAYEMNITNGDPETIRTIKIEATPGVEGSREGTFRLVFSKNTDSKTQATKPVALQIMYYPVWDAPKDAEVMVGPAGHRKDYADRQLDELREKEDAVTKNKLGVIYGLKDVPANEMMGVKFNVWTYFKGSVNKPDGSRNQQVDTVVRAVNGDPIYYTLYYHPENPDKTVDVTVERIGDNVIEADEVDIINIPGYPATDEVSVLKSWLSNRFKVDGPNVPGDTVDDLRYNMNEIIKDKMDEISWFQNYDLNLLDVVKAKARMKTIPKKASSPAQTDVIPFELDRLKYIELAVQNFSNPIVDRIRKTQLIRQKASLTNAGKKENWSGQAFWVGDQYSLILYDGAFEAEQYIFSGGKKGVNSGNVNTITHELGHIVSYKSTSTTDSEKIEVKFTKFLSTSGEKAMTPYSQGDADETFAESFQLYLTDPEYLQTHRPKIFGWMDTLNKTGSPPK